jgi:hypothetical protein
MTINTTVPFRYILSIILILFTHLSFGQKIFSIQTDSRIEALSIFYTLATADTLDTKPTPSTYYRDVKTYFERYKDHPSLNWYRKLNNWDGPNMASLGLFLSQSYPFKLQIQPDVNYIRNSPIDTFLNHFNTFYKDAQVAKFITNKQKEYQKTNRNAESYIMKSGILNDVISFYKSTQSGKFIIYPDVLCNHGSNAIASNNEKFTGMIISKVGYIEDKTKNLTDNDKVDFKPAVNVVAHESSHIYLNQFVKQYHDRLFKIKDKFLILTNGKKLADDQWENEVDELLVRAFVAKILAQKFGKETGDLEISNQAKHFKWANELYLPLDKYTQNRDQYKSIEDFYPEMMLLFESL